jgi:hypothetical protein
LPDDGRIRAALKKWYNQIYLIVWIVLPLEVKELFYDLFGKSMFYQPGWIAPNNGVRLNIVENNWIRG